MAAPTIAALGFAAGAHAEAPLLNGIFAGAEGDPAITWTITSQCAPAGCTADIASVKGWRSVAQLVDGRWQFAITKPDGAICADGRYEPAYILMSLDPVTLDGIMTNDSNYGCPGGTVTQEPFQLRQVG